MHERHGDWGFGPGFPFGPGWRGPWGGRGRGPRRRMQMFESGEIKFVILRLLKEKPRHGYEVIKALEEQMSWCYTPSAGTVYPTLQLLEDEGYIKAVDTSGKKVYQITPEGERYLEEHRDVLDQIVERVRETIRDFTGGGLGEVQGAFARLAGTTFRRAWRRGPDDPALKRVAEILRKAAEEIEQVWQPAASNASTEEK
jgi:DNA-binding PadR family transcriptional regulator